MLRLTKLGYTATEHTWTIGKAGTKKVMDNVGLAKMEDVAEYCGVLDKFKKNDVTVDLYPIWEPLLIQLHTMLTAELFLQLKHNSFIQARRIKHQKIQNLLVALALMIAKT